MLKLECDNRDFMAKLIYSTVCEMNYLLNNSRKNIYIVNNSIKAEKYDEYSMQYNFSKIIIGKGYFYN